MQLSPINYLVQSLSKEKNMFYKNIEAEIFEILKNISRINPRLKF